VLELLFDSLLEVLSPLDHLPLLVVLLPAKEDSALLVLSVLAEPVLKHELRVLLEVAILTKPIEGLMLEQLYAKERLALASPEGHALAPRVEILALLCLESEALFELLDFVLLDAEERVAASSLRIDRLGLVLHHMALALHELTKRLAAEIDYQGV